MRALGLITNSFYVPLDAHRVLVASDTRANRQEFTRQELETVYLSGLNANEMTEVSNLAKQVFDVQQVATERRPRAPSPSALPRIRWKPSTPPSATLLTGTARCCSTCA